MSSILDDSEIWVGFGHGAKLCYIPCHLIAAQLGPVSSWGLMFMHDVTGCDTVSSFHGGGKKQLGLFGTACNERDCRSVVSAYHQEIVK